MAAKTITMQQLRLIIQHLKNGLSGRQISRSIQVSRQTISGYKDKILLLEMSYDQLLDMKDDELFLLLLEPVENKVQSENRYRHLQQHLADYEKELKTHTGLTRQLLWKEYIGQFPDGYQYSQFCFHLQQQIKNKETTMHLFHVPGEKLEIDFAGKKLTCTFKDGTTKQYQVFIATFPYSGYSYVEAVPTQSQGDFINCVQNAFHYFGGAPHTIIPDNLKSAVIKANRYDPEYNALMEQLCLHYDTALLPARVAKPKDKPSVEKSVDLTYQRIYAPLRHRRFDSLHEINNAILEQLTLHHDRKFRKSDRTRKELFITQERDALRPLPSDLMLIKHSVSAKVQKNYHVVLGQDWHYYSVPHQYVGQQSTIVYTAKHVEVYCENKRVAVHQRNTQAYGFTTCAEHMPKNHQNYMEQRGWNKEFFLKWAGNISPDVISVIENILQSRNFVEQAYNACIGVLRLDQKYGRDRLIKACQMVLKAERVNYKTINEILKNNRDKLEEETNPQPPNLFTHHENIRGANNINI